MFAHAFANGDLAAARLAMNDDGGPASTTASARILFDAFLGGTLFGQVALLIAAAATCHVGGYCSAWSDRHWAALRVVVLPALHVLGFCGNQLAWHSARVNWRFIFGIERSRAHGTLSWHVLLRFSSALIAASMSAFIWSGVSGAYTYLLGALTGVYVLVAVRHLDVLFTEGGNLASILAGNLASPFNGKVSIQKFFLADQLCSQARALGDFGYLVLFAWFGGAVSPVAEANVRAALALVPYYCRLGQCVRRARDEPGHATGHCVNGGKYAVSMLAVGAAYAFSLGVIPAWPRILLAAMATLYAYLWDILRDWGLVSTDSVGPGEWPSLRRNRRFQKWVYGLVSLENLALRLLWTLPQFLTMPPHASVRFQAVTTLVAAAEVLRRVLWNIIRVENEHLNNVGQFRATRHIPLELPEAHEQPGAGAGSKWWRRWTTCGGWAAPAFSFSFTLPEDLASGRRFSVTRLYTPGPERQAVGEEKQGVELR